MVSVYFGAMSANAKDFHVKDYGATGNGKTYFCDGEGSLFSLAARIYETYNSLGVNFLSVRRPGIICNFLRVRCSI
jgi:hypothetical protein